MKIIFFESHETNIQKETHASQRTKIVFLELVLFARHFNNDFNFSLFPESFWKLNQLWLGKKILLERVPYNAPQEYDYRALSRLTWFTYECTLILNRLHSVKSFCKLGERHEHKISLLKCLASEHYTIFWVKRDWVWVENAVFLWWDNFINQKLFVSGNKKFMTSLRPGATYRMITYFK